MLLLILLDVRTGHLFQNGAYLKMMVIIAKILSSTKSNPHLGDVEAPHSCQLCECTPCRALVSQHLPVGVGFR